MSERTDDEKDGGEFIGPNSAYGLGNFGRFLAQNGLNGFFSKK